MGHNVEWDKMSNRNNIEWDKMSNRSNVEWDKTSNDKMSNGWCDLFSFLFSIRRLYHSTFFYSTFCPIRRFSIRHLVLFGYFSIQRFFQSTFCTIRPFVHLMFFPFDVSSHLAFFPFNVLSHSAFCLSTLCRSAFCTFGVCYFDILSVNRL
jgi:hypothetical protein